MRGPGKEHGRRGSCDVGVNRIGWVEALTGSEGGRVGHDKGRTLWGTLRDSRRNDDVQSPPHL